MQNGKSCLINFEQEIKSRGSMLYVFKYHKKFEFKLQLEVFFKKYFTIK